MSSFSLHIDGLKMYVEKVWLLCSTSACNLLMCVMFGVVF